MLQAVSYVWGAVGWAYRASAEEKLYFGPGRHYAREANHEKTAGMRKRDGMEIRMQY